MKKYLRPLGIVLACMLLAAGAYAAAGEDSLISLSYLRETFFPQAVQAGEEAGGNALQKTYDSAKAQLDAARDAAGSGGGGSSSDTLQRRTWTDGQTLSLSTGAGFLMLEGSAVVNHNGVVIDITAGTETASGATLAVNHRYLVGEDTSAAVTVQSGQAAIGIQGGYGQTAGKEKHTPFFDISQKDWYYDAVGYAYENGLVNGADGTHFVPGVTMNRAMMVTLLYNLAGTPAVTGGPGFRDVADGAWYAEAVRWAATQGVASGTGNNAFSPDGLITREQAVGMLYNYAVQYLNKTFGQGADLSGFGDAGRVSSWSRDAMAWAVEQKIVGGASYNGVLMLDPQRGATRAEMAALLKGFCEKIL